MRSRGLLAVVSRGAVKATAVIVVVAALACRSVGPTSITESPPVDEGALAVGMLAVDGGSLYYEVAGRGPAVVFIHGGFGDRRMWNEAFADLERDHRVVRYDHRGFGRSAPPAAPYSPVADLVRLLDDLGIERAHLVGNSLGSTLALDAALLHPERVSKLVLVAGGAGGFPVPEKERRKIVAILDAARQKGAARAVELMLAHPMVGVASRDPVLGPRLRAMVWDNRTMFGLEHWPSEKLEPPAYERLSEIRAPTLLVAGERDTPLVQAVARGTAERIAGARLVLLPGTDHLPQMERPVEFARLLREFLDAP